MMVPSGDSAASFCELFLDYFRFLFCAHVAHTYAPSFGARREYRGGLAPWQKRRATELLPEHLDGSLSLATLASEWGLSLHHFPQALRHSLSTPPHPHPHPPHRRKPQSPLAAPA